MKVLFLCAHPDDLEFSIPSMMITLAGNLEKTLDSTDKNIQKNLNTIQYGRSLFVKKQKDSIDGIPEFKIKTACMTRGEMSSFTEQIGSTLKAAKIRTKELKNSQQILTGKMPDFVGYFDGYVRVSETAIIKIKDYIMKLQPDIVIAPEPIYTWYHHPDHVRTGRIAYFAIKRWSYPQ
jgi:LmbE family N-acetylglucosaminyl deacetylase